MKRDIKIEVLDRLYLLENFLEGTMKELLKINVNHHKKKLFT